MKYTIIESSYKLFQPSGASTLLPLPQEGGERLVPMPDYDAERALGRKTRHLNAATRFFGSTASALLHNRRVREVLEGNPDRLGIYAAAETINLEDDISFDLTVKTHGPDYASPLQAPNTLANVMGSNFASFSGINGPNCTVSAGQSSGMHCLQSAALALAEGAVDCAIIGGAEVASQYHAAAFPGSRESAVAHAVTAASPADRLVFAVPALWTLAGASPAAELAGRLAAKACIAFGEAKLDGVVLAFGGDQVDADELYAALQSVGHNGAVLAAERLYGRGESCSGLLGLGVAKELLGRDELDAAHLAPAWAGSRLPGRLRRLGMAGVDEHGQGAVLVMEARP